MQVATEERARRVSLARAEREHDYRLARLARTAGAARQQAEAEARTRTLKAQKAAAKGSRRKLRALMGAPGTEHKMLPDDVEGGEDGHEDTTVLPLVIKADVYGSIEAVEQALEALSSSKVPSQPSPLRALALPVIPTLIPLSSNRTSLALWVLRLSFAALVLAGALSLGRSAGGSRRRWAGVRKRCRIGLDNGSQDPGLQRAPGQQRCAEGCKTGRGRHYAVPRDLPPPRGAGRPPCRTCPAHTSELVVWGCEGSLMNYGPGT